MNDKLPPDALIEAALLTQPEPLGEKTLRQLCDPPLSQDKLIDVLGSLKARWHGRALQLAHTAEGWRFQTAPAAFERLGALQETRSPRYSRAGRGRCGRRRRGRDGARINPPPRGASAKRPSEKRVLWFFRRLLPLR